VDLLTSMPAESKSHDSLRLDFSVVTVSRW
jgi:hypothetical protein